LTSPAPAPMHTAHTPGRSRDFSSARSAGLARQSWAHRHGSCRRPPIRSPLMGNAAHWASTAGNKFRDVARTTDNPTTKVCRRNDSTHRSHQELDTRLEKIEKRGPAAGQRRSAGRTSGRGSPTWPVWWSPSERLPPGRWRGVERTRFRGVRGYPQIALSCGNIRIVYRRVPNV